MIKLLLKYRFVPPICIFIILLFYSGQILRENINIKTVQLKSIQLSNWKGETYDEYSNLVPNFYDENGCPNVPIAYSGMTGRLGKELIFWDVSETEIRVIMCYVATPLFHNFS